MHSKWDMSSVKKGEKPRKVIFFLGFNFREKQRKKNLYPKLSFGYECFRKNLKKIVFF